MATWAVVTGATVGIGESFTRLLAALRYDIVLVARDEARLNERAAFLRSTYGVECAVIVADLSTEAGIEKVENFIASNDVEVLINNAGFGFRETFLQSSLEQEQTLLDVLVRTPMRLMHIAIPPMKAKGSGTIINVSSVASFIAGGTYSASKSYLTVLSESLHTDLTGTGVVISALCPGFTKTEFHQRGRMKMGKLPDFMWLDSDRLVADAWKDAKDGKAISIPGRQYKLLVALLRALPRSVVRKAGMGLGRKKR